MTRKFSHALDMVICWTDYLLAFTAINQNLCLSHGFYSSLEHLHHGCNYIRDQFKKVNYFKIGPEIQTVKNACVFKKKGNFYFKICTFFPHCSLNFMVFSSLQASTSSNQKRMVFSPKQLLF